MSKEPDPPRPEARDSPLALVVTSSSLFRLTLTVGLAVVISIAAVNLRANNQRNHCETYLEAPAEVALVAHAGGGLPEGDYSNSKEALDQSAANGLRLFELDFNWTADGELAIVHDWNREYRYWHHLGWTDWLASHFVAPSSAGFHASTPRYGLTRLSLETLIEWLRANPGRIITDIKSGNIEGLALIASLAGPLQNRFVPQIYSAAEYQAVRQLGYEDIILTTYRLSLSPESLREIDELDLFAVTVPENQVADAAGIISKNRIFTHTINLPVKLTAAGYYTDCLIPAETRNGV